MKAVKLVVRKNKIITNKEKIISDISSTIKDLRRIRINPHISRSKRTIIKHGLKVWTGKSPICETNDYGLKPCQINKMNCIMSYEKEQGCQNLEIYLEKDKRNKLPYIEMHLEFWKRLKSHFKSLNNESFHKKIEKREKLYNAVRNISTSIYTTFLINKRIS